MFARQLIPNQVGRLSEQIHVPLDSLWSPVGLLLVSLWSPVGLLLVSLWSPSDDHTVDYEGLVLPNFGVNVTKLAPQKAQMFIAFGQVGF